MGFGLSDNHLYYHAGISIDIDNVRKVVSVQSWGRGMPVGLGDYSVPALVGAPGCLGV